MSASVAVVEGALGGLAVLRRDIVGVLRYSVRRQKWFRLKHHYAAVMESHGEASVAEKLRTCHEVSHLAGCKSCQHTEYILHKCGHRLCPICSYKVSMQRAEYLRQRTKRLQFPKLITLTTPTHGLDYEAAFKQMAEAFKALRKDKLFRAIKGGAWCYEVIPHETYYHIHLHLLVESPFIPRKQLFAAWRRLIGVQYCSIDVRSADNAQAREYIAKYPAKNHAISTNPELIYLLYKAIKGRRLFGTWGTWYNQDMQDKADDAAQQPPPRECPCCGKTGTFFWVRNGFAVFGGEAWRHFENGYTRGRPLTETHSIEWVKEVQDAEHSN